jgi:hypothetical protein
VGAGAGGAGARVGGGELGEGEGLGDWELVLGEVGGEQLTLHQDGGTWVMSCPWSALTIGGTRLAA